MDITGLDLMGRFERGEPLVLLDVRQPDERAFCKIVPPSDVTELFVPMSEIPDRLSEIRSSSEPGPVVVYCHHGVRSRMAADWLRARGVVNVLNLAGGIDVWSRQVDPEVPRY